jgi:pyruvate-formate lyase-activating enzyme
LHLIETADKFQNNHRFFVDNIKEAKEFNLLRKFKTTKEGLENKSNRLTIEQIQNQKDNHQLDNDFIKVIYSLDTCDTLEILLFHPKAAMKQRIKKYKELTTRIKREKSLRKLEENYDLKTVSLNNHPS